MIGEQVGDDELTRAVMRQALEQVGAEERALLRVALARAAGDIDPDAEHELRLLLHFDAGRVSSLATPERWALASALRRMRGMGWVAAHEVAQVAQNNP